MPKTYTGIRFAARFEGKKRKAYQDPENLIKEIGTILVETPISWP